MTEQSARCTRLCLAGLIAVGSTGLAISSASGSGTVLDTLYLNSHESAAHDVSHSACVSAGGCGPQRAASTVLAAGTTYTIKVTGAVSVWGAWQYRRCGKPEPTPEFGSPGIKPQPANDDAQFRFAQTVSGTQACPKLPQKSGSFQIELSKGTGWFHPIANGNPMKPSHDNDGAGDQHPYAFTVVGDGVAPQFRFVDFHPSDNDGEFRIQIISH